MSAVAIAPTELSADDAERARAAARALSETFGALGRIKKGDAVLIDVTAGTGAEHRAVAVPLPAFRLFVELLAQLADGNAVTVVPMRRELTTQEAADLLNVSRPYLVRLLEEGKIPFRRVGSRRRVLFADVMALKQREATNRQQVLDDLTKDAEDLGLGY